MNYFHELFWLLTNVLKIKTMMKNYLKTLFALLALSGLQLSAQVSSYTFSSSNGTYTPITGGTVLGTPSNDDQSFNNNPLGFTFFYNGVAYTNASIQSNGFIAMGATVTNSYSAISTGGTNNIIAALNFDLIGNGVTSELRYQTIGSAPNRTFVVQWTNYEAFAFFGDTYNFQIRLNESNNSIDVVYGTFNQTNFLWTSEVGLRGNSNADFNNRRVLNGSTTWATSTAGVFNNDKCDLAAGPPMLVPASGLTYSWSAVPPAAPITLTFTGVTTTGMTLNWIDNSTTENNFLVFRSLDNINFTQVATVASATQATIGTPYNSVQTGLFSNTLYYWRVYAVAAVPSAPLSGSQATLAGTMCGTYTIGPTGAYTSITAAVTALVTNGVLCPVIFELQPTYLSTVETFPINIPFVGASASNTITVRPMVGAVNLSITSTATQTINFNGAQYFSFDGRPGSTGPNIELTIQNNSTTGNAVRYISDAVGCNLKFVRVFGVNTSTATTTAGVIHFGNSVANGTGNSNDTIANCEIGPGATLPIYLLYGNNTTANIFNVNNVIQNNLFRDHFSATLAHAAIQLNTGNHQWTISGNSFFQTATRNYTGAPSHFMVNINSGSGTQTGGFRVLNNFFGGSAPNCGGTPHTNTATGAHRLVCLQINTGGVGSNEVQGNTFRNFSFGTTSTASTLNGIWCAIYGLGTGNNMNVGNTTPNIIGSTTAAGDIVTSTSGSGGSTVGIYFSAASGVVNISNNLIGGITANSSSTAISSSVMGINVGTAIGVTISGNTIGSPTVANSIINAISNSATAGVVTGIWSSSTNLGGNQITNNRIMNLTNQYAGTSTVAPVRGIYVSSGVNTINGNIIRNLTNSANCGTTTTTPSIMGIWVASISSGSQVVTNNIIYSLKNNSTTTTAIPVVVGINNTGNTLIPSVYANNRIYDLSGPGSTTSSLQGHLIYGGMSRVVNNFIALGIDSNNVGYTPAHEYIGIHRLSTASVRIIHNSVHIAGTGVASGAVNTMAHRKASQALGDTILNNIFFNSRSNATTGGFHYGINLNNATNLVCDNNDLFANGTDGRLGIFGATPHTTLSSWISGTGLDLNSVSANPNYVSATNLHINNASMSFLESKGLTLASVPVDIDLDVRPGPIPSVNGGGINSDIGADEFDGIPIEPDMGAVALVDPGTTGCRSTTETVRIRIKNHSVRTINFATNNCTVSSWTTGTNPVVFPNVVLNSGTLLGGATMDVVVSTTYDMTAPGNYTFHATTGVAGDMVPTNDTMMPVIRVSNNPTLTIASPGTICSGDTVTLNPTATTFGMGPGNQTFVWTGNVPILDLQTVTAPQSVTAGSINANQIISVTIDTIFHTWDADLVIDLVAPNNSAVMLSNGNGGSGDNYFMTEFIMTAPASITTGFPPFTGSFIPQAPFSGFTGSANGTWALRVYDQFGGDQGTINKWTLKLPNANSVTSYNWAPATGLSSTTVANPQAFPTVTTQYTLTITDANGCTKSDTVTVFVNPAPLVNLGPDTTRCMGSVLLDAQNPGDFYLWSTGATTQTITATVTGNYYVTVTNSFNCSKADTILVTINPLPVVALGNDSTLCGNDSLLLDAGNPGGTYTWSTGASTQQIYANSSGTYIVVVDDVNGCQNSDTINVTVAPIPPVALGNDTLLCSTSTYILDAGNPGNSYLWNTGATTQQISIISSGTYNVAVTNAAGCIGYDTINITMSAPIIVALGADTGFCPGGFYTLDAGNPGDAYLWNTGATTQQIVVTTAGQYNVTVTDGNGCSQSDTINIVQFNNPVVNLGPDTTVCNTTLVLDAGSGMAAYLWNTSATTQQITVFAAGQYIVTVTNINGCQNSDTINITLNTPPSVTFLLSPSVVCINWPAFTLTGGSPSGGVYSGPGVSGGQFNPATAGVGNHTITYTYTDANNCSSFATQNITVNACSGVEESFAGGLVSLYPNPNNGMFFIKWEGISGDKVQIIMTDLSGRRVFDRSLGGVFRDHTESLDVTGLENGIYILTLMSGNDVKTFRVVYSK
jgi:subtilisin-like proprotein convertase family protein